MNALHYTKQSPTNILFGNKGKYVKEKTNRRRSMLKMFRNYFKNSQRVKNFAQIVEKSANNENCINTTGRKLKRRQIFRAAQIA